MRPSYWPRATRALRRADPVIGRLIDAYGRESLQARGDPFGTLARSILGQQISVKGASALWERLEHRLGRVTPETVAASSQAELIGCGLSRGKIAYLRTLAGGFLEGSIDVSRWREVEDETVIAELTRIKGIGRWTAEMFLIFHLLRPDVLPLDDLGLKRAIARYYAGGDRPSRSEMLAIGEAWKPWRSVATWYLWRSLDPIPIAY